jgi:hypothetical protein
MSVPGCILLMKGVFIMSVIELRPWENYEDDRGFVMSPAEHMQARQLTLARLGVTYEELEEMARKQDFPTGRLQSAWLMLKWPERER